MSRIIEAGAPKITYYTGSNEGPKLPKEINGIPVSLAKSSSKKSFKMTRNRCISSTSSLSNKSFYSTRKRAPHTTMQNIDLEILTHKQMNETSTLMSKSLSKNAVLAEKLIKRKQSS